MTSILKLTNGLEIVGTVEINNDEYGVVVDRPLQINYRYFQGSTPSVSFVRYIMFADTQTYSFKQQDVMNVVNAREAFANYYHGVVEQYYSELEKVIDKELSSISDNDNLHENILEMMSVEGATMN
jgi:hypothetical protein